MHSPIYMGYFPLFSKAEKKGFSNIDFTELGIAHMLTKSDPVKNPKLEDNKQKIIFNLR